MESQGGQEAEPKPIVMNIEPIEKTPREKEVRAVAEKARSTALDRLGGASDLTDYMRWHRAASVYLTAPNIDWIWDYGGTTPEDLIEEQESERFTKGNARNAAAAEEMRATVAGLETKPGMVKVALKRVRNEAGMYDYRVLAAFPERSAEDPLDGSVEGYKQRTGEDVIFFEPENACVNHACDDLFKENRTEGFYMPAKSLSESIQQLQRDKRGANEYLLEKTETGAIKQDAQNYIMVGLLGGYSNERFRVRVSDYWNKPKPQTAVPAVQ